MEESVSQQLLTLATQGGTGGFNSNGKKTATKIPGLVPINIDTNVEFYFTIRNTQSKRNDGQRLFYDKQTTELAPSEANPTHNTNQLWRF